MRWSPIANGLAAACLLASCSAVSPRKPLQLENQFVDSATSADWSGEDLEAHRSAFLKAVDAARGETVEWAGDGARGRITAKDARLVVSADEPRGKPAPVGLRATGAMELNLGIHVLTSNANVRLGPSTDDKVVATLKAGTRVEVVGRLVRAPWALTAQNGRVRGYVFEDLMARPAGAASRLAGAALATPTYCRSLSQVVEHAYASVETDSIACKGEGAWFLAREQEVQ